MLEQLKTDRLSQVILAGILLAACFTCAVLGVGGVALVNQSSVPISQPAQPVQVAQVEEASERAEPVQVSLPEEAPPEPAADNKVEDLPEETKRSYLPLLFMEAMVVMLEETAGQVQADQIDGFEALGQLIAIGAMFNAAQEALAEPAPDPKLQPAWQEGQAAAPLIQEVVKRWIDKEISSAEVTQELEPARSQVARTMEVADTIMAEQYGVDKAELSRVREELMAGLRQDLRKAAEAEPTAVPTTSTPAPIGMSRLNPFPRSAIASTSGWEVQVLETQRGEPAWQAIQAVNMFNEPAPAGMEYLLVKLRVKSTHADGEEHSIGQGDFKVTGDRFFRYSTADAVEPDPQLDARLFNGGQTEGWTGYLVGQGEGNLVLIVDELLNFDEDRYRFIALDEAVSLSIPAELADIRPSDIGLDRANPAAIGQTVTTDEWQVTVREAIRGNEAWAMAQAANQFNDLPEPGMEYVAVRVHARLISTEDRAVAIDNSYFKSTGSAGVLYDQPSVVDPDPMLDVSLFPGGQYEGWVVLQAAQDETGLTAVFEPLFDFGNKNRRFLALE